MILTVTLNPTMDKLLWLDELHCGQVNRVKELSSEPGGKGVNIGKTLSRLGRDVVATGFLGGSTGHYYEDALRAQGLSTAFVFTDGETRINHIVIDERYGGQTQIIESGSLAPSTEFGTLKRTLSRLLADCELVVLAGSLPPGAPPAWYAEMAELAASKDVPVVVNALEGAMVPTLEVRPFLVKPDIRDIGTLLGHSLETTEGRVAALRDLRDAAEYAVVSTGFEALAARGDEAFIATAPVCPVSGASIWIEDKLLAGMIDMLLAGGGLADACRRGMAMAVLAGTSGSGRLETIEGIEAHVETVEVNPLDL